MDCRLWRLPAYVSLSRFTMRAGAEAIHWRMKFEPMKPAPPVTRMISSMLGVPHRVRTRLSDSNHNHSRTRSLSTRGEVMTTATPFHLWVVSPLQFGNDVRAGASGGLQLSFPVFESRFPNDNRMISLCDL